MPASGSSIFADADGYQATLQDMLDLVVLQPRDFSARLTWVELPSLHLLVHKKPRRALPISGCRPGRYLSPFLHRRDCL